MQIALVTYALQIGGVETFLRLMSDYFTEKGHRVTIYETFCEGRSSKIFLDEGYFVKQIFPRFYHSRIRHARLIARELSSYDVVILNDVPFAQAAIGLLPERTVVIPVLHNHMESMYRNACANVTNWDVLVTVSPMLRERSFEFGADVPNTICIPHGVRVPTAWPKEETIYSNNDTIRLVYIGSINHTQKGVFYLTGITERLVKKSISFTLDIIGDGPDLPELRKRMAVNDHTAIRFHGALIHETALKILRHADVLILPSHYEGFGIVILEAMSCGVIPIVSHLHNVTDSIVEHGLNGFLITIGNEEGFASTIVELARNRLRLKSVSKSAWQTALNRFSYQSTGASYLEQINILCDRFANQKKNRRTGVLDMLLLGDLPNLPLFLVRPVRKVLRLLGLLKR
jgi:glycosyltransferase involved in cell wall biosynthesis